MHDELINSLLISEPDSGMLSDQESMIAHIHVFNRPKALYVTIHSCNCTYGIDMSTHTHAYPNVNVFICACLCVCMCSCGSTWTHTNKCIFILRRRCVQTLTTKETHVMICGWVQQMLGDAMCCRRVGRCVYRCPSLQFTAFKI